MADDSLKDIGIWDVADEGPVMLPPPSLPQEDFDRAMARMARMAPGLTKRWRTAMETARVVVGPIGDEVMSEARATAFGV